MQPEEKAQSGCKLTYVAANRWCSELVVPLA